MNVIPPYLIELMNRELARDERILWQVRPAASRLIRASSSTFFFGVPFFSFSVFWTIGACGGFKGSGLRGFRDGMPPWFPLLWGSMFMIPGACMLLSPLWAWWVARHTIYTITDRRAIIIEALFRRKIQSFIGVHRRNTVRHENSRGYGDIIFEREAIKGGKGQTFYRDVGFLGLADVKAVEQILHDSPHDPRFEPQG